MVNLAVNLMVVLTMCLLTKQLEVYPVVNLMMNLAVNLVVVLTMRQLMKQHCRNGTKY